MAIADIFARRCVPVFQLLTAQIAARYLSVGAPLLAVRIRRPSFEGPFPPKKPGYAVNLVCRSTSDESQRLTADFFSDLLCKDTRTVLISKGPQQGTVHNCMYEILNTSAECEQDSDQFSGFKSPFTIFLKDNHDQIDRLEDGRLNLKLLAKMWKSLDKEGKESYSEQYKELQVAHKKEVEDFLNRMGDNKKEYLKQLTKYRSQRTKYLKKFRLRKQGLLKPRKLSAFNVYLSDTLKGNIHSLDEAQGAMKEATETWKSLSQLEKKSYADKAEKLHKQRMAEYDERMEAMKA